MAKSANPLYPILVGFVMCFAHFSYLWGTVIPQINTFRSGADDPGYAHGGLDSLGAVGAVYGVFCLVFGMALWSFFTAVFTDPGGIPITQRWIKAEFGISAETERRFADLLADPDSEPDRSDNVQLVKSLPVVERKKKKQKDEPPGYRFCSTCNIYKPDRTHHCRMCDRCILRMDHHCPWIANCVGFYNYKFFLLFLFYAILSAVYIVFAMFPRVIHVFRPMINVKYWLTHDLFVCIGYLFCLLIAVILSIFFVFHLKLALSAMTTIELREKHDVQANRHQFDVAHKKFDRGPLANWMHIFGPAWMWFLPLQSRKEGEGLYDTTSASPPEEDTVCGGCSKKSSTSD